MGFFHESSIWVYLFIFLGKILEVTVSIVRIVLINPGERLKGSIIATENTESQKLVSLLRERNFAVTVLSGKGKDGDRELMVLHIKRKRIKEAVELIKTNLEQAVIVVNDTKVMHGGFIKK